MRKRMLLAAGALTAIGCLVLIVLALLPPRPGVTKANVDRIEIGMMESEVQAIFGQPANEELRIQIPAGPQQVAGMAILKFDSPNKAWSSDDGFALLKFDADAKVTEKRWTETPQTLMQKVRRWLHF